MHTHVNARTQRTNKTCTIMHTHVNAQILRGYAFQFIPVGVFKLSERGGALVNIEPMLEGTPLNPNESQP
jgi:hypothetical protein